MAKKMEEKPEKITFNIEKEKNFSEWFTEIVKKAGLADLRYNVKGFVVFQPWSVLSMEEIYKTLEGILQRKGHRPYWFPAVIPEENFYRESEHVEGFSPEVFWITEAGGTKLEERLALRPTSETAFYQMFALWIRSYKDLPFKTYQRAQVFRYETKATRPFLRSREFHWIEAHDAFASREDAEKQVKEDIEITTELLHSLAIPFHFFKRPQWDKFAGAENTYAADALMPDGKLMQLPSTHFLGQNFAKAFNVQFTDKNGKEKTPFITCYGPAVGRIFAAMVSIHGDSKGLVFPFKAAPVQVLIVPIHGKKKSKKVSDAVKKIIKQLQEKCVRLEVDDSDSGLGDKFFYWEMKGVPLRVEFGERELKKSSVTIFRRDTGAKKTLKLSALEKEIEKTSKAIDSNLFKKASTQFEKNIMKAEKLGELKGVLDSGKIALCGICSDGKDALSCAEQIEKNAGGSVRGVRMDKKVPVQGNCVACGKKAKEMVYVAKSY